jgi:hypothetical protein
MSSPAPPPPPAAESHATVQDQLFDTHEVLMRMIHLTSGRDGYDVLEKPIERLERADNVVKPGNQEQGKQSSSKCAAV